MTREEAESERDRMAEEQPESTWLVAEQKPGEWSVVKVGLKPSTSADGEATESRPRPPTPDDPRPRHNPNWGF
jgi:hypothetical protein